MEPEFEPGRGGSDGTGRPPLPSIELSGDGNVSLEQGNRAVVHFMLKRTGTTNPVTLSVNNLPFGVSASFNPATLPRGNGGANVALELIAASGAPAADTEIRIIGTAYEATLGALPMHLTLVNTRGAPTLPIGFSDLPQTVIGDSMVQLFTPGQANTSFVLEFAEGVEGTVSFEMSGLPSSITPQFEPPTLAALGAASSMAVGIALSADPNIVVTGDSMILQGSVQVSVAGELSGTVSIPIQVLSLGSGKNYFLYAGPSPANATCNALFGVSVTITITEDLVAAPPTADQQPGFAFQLNASSPIDAAVPGDPAWIVSQQYIIGVGSGKIRGAVNNWTAASISMNQVQTINGALVLATLPVPDMLPAGYTLTITLTTDAQSNVNGVSFGVNPGGTQELILTTLTKDGGNPVTNADLAPIVAFELNLVGPGDGKHANFLSGAGTITYAATVPIEALSTLPACVAYPAVTVETSNSVYGPLPTDPRYSFTQSFSVKTHVVDDSPTVAASDR